MCSNPGGCQRFQIDNAPEGFEGSAEEEVMLGEEGPVYLFPFFLLFCSFYFRVCAPHF